MTAMYRGPEPVDCSAVTWTATLGLSAPTVSHHFRALREAGLTHTEIDGHTRTIRTRAADIEARFPGLLGAVLGSTERHNS